MSRSIISRLMIVLVAIAFVVYLPVKVNAETNQTTLSITSQPSDYTGPAGSTATFSVEAEGDGLLYQWQVLSSGDWKNTNLNGAQTDTLSVDIVKYRNGYKYRCVVSDSLGDTLTSNEATLHVGLPPKTLSITSQPADFYGSIGDIAVFSVEAEGDGLS